MQTKPKRPNIQLVQLASLYGPAQTSDHVGLLWPNYLLVPSPNGTRTSPCRVTRVYENEGGTVTEKTWGACHDVNAFITIERYPSQTKKSLPPTYELEQQQQQQPWG